MKSCRKRESSSRFARGKPSLEERARDLNEIEKRFEYVVLLMRYLSYCW